MGDARLTVLAPWPSVAHPCVRALAPCSFLLLNEAGESATAVETELPGVFEACLNGSHYLASCGTTGEEVELRTADACDGRWRIMKDCAGGTAEYITNTPGWLWVANDTARLSTGHVAFPFSGPDATVFWVPHAGANCPAQSVRITLSAQCLRLSGKDRFDWKEGSADWLSASWGAMVVLWVASGAVGQPEHMVGTTGLLAAAHMPILQRVTYSTYVASTGAALSVSLLFVITLFPRAILTDDKRVRLPHPGTCARLQLSLLAVGAMFVCLGLSWQFPTSQIQFV